MKRMKLLHLILDICDPKSPRYETWLDTHWLLNEMHIPRPYFTHSLMVLAFFGHVPAVKMLIERDQIDLNERDWDCRTPLISAAQNGQEEEVVKLLVEQKN